MGVTLMRVMRFQVDRPQVVGETIQGETIVIHLGTGTYYSLLGSAAVIWEEVAQGATMDEIVEALEAVYDGGREELAEAASTFIDTLRREALIVAAKGSQPAERVSRHSLPEPVPFSPPSLQKYTDMQDIILLDPVHEVSAEGWPHPQEAGA
jgi:hypothetical protein